MQVVKKLKSSFQPLKGVYAATFTPFNSNGSLNYDVIPHIVSKLASCNVQGAFVCGTTGESMSLTKEEKIKIIKCYMNTPLVKNQQFKIIFHVGSNILTECRELAQLGQELKVSAIACMPPFFFKPSNVNDLIECLSFVASGAPELPFYYYHFPAITGVNIPVSQILNENSKNNKIPNFFGIKYTDSNMGDLGNSLMFSNYNILFGYDIAAICPLVLGCQGCIGSTYNIIPDLINQLIDKVKDSDINSSQLIQKRIRDFISISEQFGQGKWLTVQKMAFSLIMGIDAGPIWAVIYQFLSNLSLSSKVRLPLQNLTQNQIEKLTKDLKINGFL